MFQKKKRVDDASLLASVRQLSCLACGKTPCDAHHVTSRKAGGDDTFQNVMPLCRRHHQEWHQVGPVRMFRRYPYVRVWLSLAGRDDVLGKEDRIPLVKPN